MIDTLNALYDSTSSRTLAAWQQHPDIGERRRAPRYAKDKFALATGITPPLSPAIAALLQELHELAAGDPLADVMPATALHFTFLAVTDAIYATPQPPQEIPCLTALFNDITPLTVTIRDLRLVALPDQLLLAGIPDAASLAQRQRFAEALLASPWKSALTRRYGNTPLPPPFWHSTLVRYEASRLPPRFREFFARQHTSRFGEVRAPLMLAMVNYNWSHKGIVGTGHSEQGKQ
ncbi:hypothetical protein [Enterobacter sp. ENT03]|uniref:hypothetical protein n=1 Tax=Enterobacter sp. ENT03 TaxID=2854780 RepID=UPI001C44D114|nr:hypothetical protein [Enterobacter sp. ENT03]MBV7407148.1 hypothetical protein [Enterobacter sp. ENT03]